MQQNKHIKYYPLFFILIIFYSCVPIAEKQEEFKLSDIWYRQAEVDIGRRIIIKSPNEGIAISSGRGDIPGKAYYLENGKWIPFYQFPYSDFPLISYYDTNKIWTVNHLVHHGLYKPELYQFFNNKVEPLYLPLIKWDEIDYAMWKGIFVLSPENVRLVGQQGNIFFFDGKKWSEEKSPVDKSKLESLLNGDINDIFMINESLGWGCGKDGLIIKYENNEWKRVESPTLNHLEKIYMINENKGVIVGQRGTILLYENDNWEKIKINTAENLFSVKALDEKNIFVVGSKSTLIFSDGENWKIDKSVRMFEDNFFDIDIIEQDNNKLIWIIGFNGIYTNAQSYGVSFTDITNQSSLRKYGKKGLFFSEENKSNINLYVINEDAPPVFNKNDGSGRFSEIPISIKVENEIFGTNVATVADFNNDGYADIVEIRLGNTGNILLGQENSFRDFTEYSNIIEILNENVEIIGVQAADLNNDGNIDLIFSFLEHPPVFLINNGAAQFSKLEIPEFNYGRHKSFGLTVADFNNDLLPDIFMTFSTPINNYNYHLYINKGNFNFDLILDSSFNVEVGYSTQTTIAVSEDFNKDGYMDIFIHHLKKNPVLLINNGDLTFKDISIEAGLTEIIYHNDPSTGFIATGDVNNDGRIDLFIGSKLLLNSPDLIFEDITIQTGINFSGNPSFADIDNDGDLDLFIGNSQSVFGSEARAILYRNNINNNNYLKFKITGSESNRSAIGSNIILTAKDNFGNEIYKSIKQTGFGSATFNNQNYSEIHFGISDTFNYSAEIIFPSGIKKIINNIKPSETIIVNESSILLSYYTGFIKSMNRTFLLANKVYESLKIIIFILILLILYKFNSVNGNDKRNFTFILLPILILIFFYVVHNTVLEPLFVNITSPLLIVSFVGFVFISVNGIIIKKREAKLISHYKIESLIGEGGMGKVYKANDITDKKIVALKILNPELITDAENRKRLTNEGQILSQFNNKNIIKVFEIGESKENVFISMEYLEGGTLNDYIKKNHPLKIEEIKKITLEICLGLKAVHEKNIIHRDLKSNNIMLDINNNIKLMDFGLSKSSLLTKLTSKGTLLGTLGYISPEQITNSTLDNRSDIFSLGVVLYELCTNTIPFKGENEMAMIHSIFNYNPQPPSEINSNIPSEFDKIILKCLAKNMAERFNNAEEIIKAIESVS